MLSDDTGGFGKGHRNPRTACHALADYGRTRAEGTGDRPAAAV
jgi:hypothetical protein